MPTYIYNTKSHNVYIYSEKLAKRGDFIVLTAEQGAQYEAWTQKIKRARAEKQPLPHKIRFDIQVSELLKKELNAGGFVAQPIDLPPVLTEPVEDVMPVIPTPKAQATPAIDPEDLGSLLDGAESQ